MKLLSLKRNLIILGCLILLFSCKEDVLLDHQSFNEGQKEPVDSTGLMLTRANDFTQSNSKRMFEDDESEIIFNTSIRSMRVNQPLQLTINDKELLLRFFSPRKINNVKVWAKLAEYPEEFLLAQFEELPPFIEYREELPMVTRDVYFTTKSGKKILFMKNQYLSGADLTLRTECDDPFYQKVTNIPSTLKVEFGKFDGTGYWAYKILPAQCKEGIAFAMNMMYMFSTDYFKSEFAKRTYYSDANRTQVIPHEQILNRLLNVNGKNRLVFGHVSGVNGLGGGTAFGIAGWQYLGHYADDGNDPHTFFHEYAHCIGYGHNGNMTYDDGSGFNVLCNNVYKELSLRKELPVYSRRFMHTRRSGSKLYGAAKWVASKYIIEDPELDAIDGGLQIMKNPPAIEDVTKGDALNLTIDYTMIPGATNDTYTPVDVCYRNGKLYVLNNAKNNYSIELFSVENGQATHIKQVRNWTANNGSLELSLDGEPTGIACDAERVYVNRVDSRTEVFDLDMNYVTTIGNGEWGTNMNQTIHAFETVPKAGLVIIKDKKKLCVYLPEDIKPESRQNIPRVAQSAIFVEAMSVYGADMDSKYRLFCTHYNQKKVYTFDFGQPIRELTDFPIQTSWSFEKNPFDIVCIGDKLYMTQTTSNANESALVEIDKNTGAVLKGYVSLLKSKEIVRPEKMSVAAGNIFIVDRGAKKVRTIPIGDL